MPKTERTTGAPRRGRRPSPAEPPAPRLSPERAFVVQLESRRPANARTLRGRVEHLVTGEACHFGSAEELVGFMSRFRGLLLITMLLIPTVAMATAPARICVKECAKALKGCLSAAKAQRAGLRAGCSEASSNDRKECLAAAKAASKETAQACRTVRGECKDCCRATAQPCTTLRIVDDAPRGVSETVSQAGGTIRATAADGTVYTLDVPAGALTAPVTITLTPVTVVGHLPLSGGLAAAVAFEPEGLLLFEPAILTIELRPGTPVDGLVGFGAEDDGEGLHLRLLARESSRLTMSVTHFSMVGAGIAITSDIQRLFEAAVSSAEIDALNHIAALQARGEQDASVYFQVLAAWYSEIGFVDPGVLSGLQLAFDDARLRKGIRQFLIWLEAIHDVGRIVGEDFLPDFAALIADAKQVAARKINIVLASNLGRCALPASLAPDETALFWQGVAEALGVVGLVPGTELDLATVAERLCARVEVAAMLSAPLAGDATVTVQPRLVQPALTPQMRVTVSGTGLVDPVPAGQIASGGTFTTVVHVVSGEIVLDVEACIDEPDFPHLRRVCARTQVARGLSVEPAQVTLTPGGQQTFQALRNGQAVSATWSASGGTIDSTSGLFTAPSQPGTSFVTAHAVDTGETATATVLVLATTTTTLPTGGAVVLGQLTGSSNNTTRLVTALDPVFTQDICGDADPIPAIVNQPFSASSTCQSSSSLLGPATFTVDSSVEVSASPSVLVPGGPLTSFSATVRASYDLDVADTVDPENPRGTSSPAGGTNATASVTFSATAGQQYAIGISPGFWLDPAPGGTTGVIGITLTGPAGFFQVFLTQGVNVVQNTLVSGTFPATGGYQLTASVTGSFVVTGFVNAGFQDEGSVTVNLTFPTSPP